MAHYKPPAIGLRVPPYALRACAAKDAYARLPHFSRFLREVGLGSGCRAMPALSLTPVGFGKYSLDSGGSGCNAGGLSDVEASIRAALSISVA